MRVICTGSRNWMGIYGDNRIFQVLNIILALADVLGEKLTIIHGDCPTGADQVVDRWARRREGDGVTVETLPADWRILGKRAGPVRNKAMVDRGADMCIGFVRGDARGTRITLAMAAEAGIPTFTVDWETREESDA